MLCELLFSLYLPSRDPALAQKEILRQNDSANAAQMNKLQIYLSIIEQYTPQKDPDNDEYFIIRNGKKIVVPQDYSPIPARYNGD